jgi:hypothetical protein
VRPGNWGSRNKPAKREVKVEGVRERKKGRRLERIKIISAISQILTAEGSQTHSTIGVKGVVVNILTYMKFLPSCMTEPQWYLYFVKQSCVYTPQ